MIDIEKLRQVVEENIDGDLFLVDIKIAPGNEIEVTIDSDSSVEIDDCVAISRAVEDNFDREEEDFELTVTSAGIGQPLKLLRQYKKLIGRPVEVLLKDGTKITAELKDADEESVTVSYTEMKTVEGKKRKEKVEVTEKYNISDIKYTKEYLDFK